MFPNEADLTSLAVVLMKPVCFVDLSPATMGCHEADYVEMWTVNSISSTSVERRPSSPRVTSPISARATTSS